VGDLHGAGRYDHGRLHLDNLDLITADAGISVTGSIGSPRDPDLNLKLKARSGPQTIGKFTKLLKHFKKERRSLVEVSASIQGKIANPAVDGVSSWRAFIEICCFRTRRPSATGINLTVTGEKWKIARGRTTVNSISADFGYSATDLISNSLIFRQRPFASDVSRADPQRGFDAVTLESKDKETLSFAFVPIEEHPPRISHRRIEQLFLTTASQPALAVRGILFDDARAASVR
jgi:hypothetical protein